MSDRVHVLVNFADMDSIAEAEKKKLRLENNGYELISTRQGDLMHWVLTYEK